MTRYFAMIMALVAGLLAFAAPIGTSFYLARQDSIDRQMATVGAVARDVLRRADETGNQGVQAIGRLQAARAADPCMASEVQLMSAITLASDELEGVGYVDDDQLKCSSLGAYAVALPIGPPDYLSATRTYVRTAVTFPLVGGKTFGILTRGQNGYATIINPYLAVDVAVPSAKTSLGVYSYSTRFLIAGQGYSDPLWLNELGRAHVKDFIAGGYLVSLRRSERFDTVAFAAIPLSSVGTIFQRQLEILVPVGIATGIALAALVFYVARIQLALPAALREALRRREFYVEYQPVVDLRTRQWVGAEVLVRWRRPGGEIIRPDVFIPVAEDAGLIGRITAQVAGIVAREAADIFARHPDFHLGINLAAADLADQNTLELVTGLLKATAAAPGNLIVEATERGLIRTGVCQDLLHKLRRLGVRVAIDDFGTGYSSLSYLQNFPLDILKIDKSFVETIGTGAATSQVVFHIIEMAKSLKLGMIAEGVETEAQAKVLRDYGVERAQGWLFAKPMGFDELAARLRAPG